MFFEDTASIPSLAAKSGFTIFVLDSADFETLDSAFSPKNSRSFAPDPKGKITVDTVREIIDFCKVKQTKDFFIVIESAETLNEQAQNALLKLLEEPAKNYHFVLQVRNITTLLPTILSRGRLYIKKIENSLKSPVKSSELVKNYAKKLIAADSHTLPSVIKEITSDKNFTKKDTSRIFTLEIVGTAIEILYKSYFATENPKFLKKLPKLLTLYDNLKQNGHIKLHLTADLC